MPAPGETRPARFDLRLSDRIWDALYEPLVGVRRARVAAAQPPAVPHHSPVSERRLRRSGHASRRARVMAMIVDLVFQLLQMTLVIAVAPLLTGLVRATKARLMRRRGPPLIQPYRDLVRLARKEAVVADTASWLFRFVPYLVFAATWVAAALVPTFATGLLFSWSADLIAIIALLGAARFFLALAGLDVGTSFGGLGSSREALFGALAEPAMIVIVFTLALVAGSTQLSTVAAYMVSSNVGLRVSLGMALVALIIVAHRRERAHSGRQSRHPPRTDHGARGDDPRIFRPPSGGDRTRRDAEAGSLCLAHRLRLRALGPGDRRRQRRRPAARRASPISSSSPSPASRSACSRPASPRCASSACPISSARRLMLGFLGALLLFVSRTLK